MWKTVNVVNSAQGILSNDIDESMLVWHSNDSGGVSVELSTKRGYFNLDKDVWPLRSCGSDLGHAVAKVPENVKPLLLDSMQRAAKKIITAMAEVAEKALKADAADIEAFDKAASVLVNMGAYLASYADCKEDLEYWRLKELYSIPILTEEDAAAAQDAEELAKAALRDKQAEIQEENERYYYAQ